MTSFQAAAVGEEGCRVTTVIVCERGAGVLGLGRGETSSIVAGYWCVLIADGIIVWQSDLAAEWVLEQHPGTVAAIAGAVFERCLRDALRNAAATATAAPVTVSDVLLPTPSAKLVHCRLGACVLPGFVDSHVHLFDAGRRLQSVNMRECRSRDEFRDLLRHAVDTHLARSATAATHDSNAAWITGGDWDDNLLGAMPDRSWLDDITCGVPTLLARFDCHTAVANTAALRAAGIDPAVGETIDGGVFEQYAAMSVMDGGALPAVELSDDAVCELSGIVRERAIARLKKAFPPSDSSAGRVASLRAAERELLQHGVTGVHTMTSLDFRNGSEIETLIEEAVAGRLRIRVAVAVRLNELPWAIERFAKPDAVSVKEWVTLLGVKVFVDGSLGSRTACFTEPFVDRGGHGVRMMTVDDVAAAMVACTEAGVMLMAHAIGDAAVATVLQAARLAKPALVRVEHCQHVRDEEIALIHELTAQRETRVIASMQPTHAVGDAAVVVAALGESRALQSFRFRSLRDAGAVLSFGSDWMVMPPRPVDTIRVAVELAAPPFSCDERVSVADAIHALTVGPAAAARWTRRFGAVGDAADFTVMQIDSHDGGVDWLTTLTWGSATVAATVVGGRLFPVSVS